ncbi:hypothetical protein LY10_04251 [Planktotalea frisia]|jgi:tetratricopeptide (TPR) repeat protein|uniref:Tetratricopeptide repeat protein n=1 Tax=Planktotalea frisia TaxID=696762 RepID=A0A1L9P049_9RHOB|nr:polysaccharide pyruvyl transferase family protein [Planktotalea frisia]OJI94897.1 tetratricopeptide repeat protein [Planktotalea frisia]PZX17977.1 hypothetical protein LY10_04251 [Planktotalea frisia]
MADDNLRPKFGVLHFSYANFGFERRLVRDQLATINLGDFMQTLACRNLYQKLDINDEDVIEIDRDRIVNYNGPPVIVVLNACFYQHCFPVPEKIIPVFVGFQAKEDVIVANHAYFERHQPIGCRDTVTCDLFLKHGISAHVTGCLTLSFDSRCDYPLDGKVMIAYGEGSGAFPSEALDTLPKHLLPKLEFVFQRKAVHALPLNISDMQSAEKHAKFLLDHYRSNASIVVTPLHHAATPCMSSGIPVVLCRNDADDRFSFLRDIIDIHSKPNFDAINWADKPANVDHIRSNLLSYSKEGVQKAMAFFHQKAADFGTLSVDVHLPTSKGTKAPEINKAIVSLAQSNRHIQLAAYFEEMDNEARGRINANGLVCIGKAYVALKYPAQAVDLFKVALTLRPKMWLAHTKLITTLTTSGRATEAFLAAQEAEVLCGTQAVVLLCAGRAAAAVDEIDIAINWLERSAAIDPVNFSGRVQLANLLGSQKGQWSKAQQHIEVALQLRPDDLNARSVDANVKLHLGHFGAGFDSRKYRFGSGKVFGAFRRPFRHPTWNGEPTVKSLLLLPETEQGVGYELLAATLIPSLEAKGIEVFFETSQKLIPFLTSLYPNARFIPFSAEGEIDLLDPRIEVKAYFSAACSFLRRDHKDFPVLSMMQQAADLSGAVKPLRIGLSWRSTNPSTGKSRSIPLQRMVRLFDKIDRDIALVNLQYGDVSAEISTSNDTSVHRIEYQSGINYVHDTATFLDTVRSVDVVVSIDNSTLFFAGHLNKPTFALLSPTPHWVWGKAQEQSIWFPSIQLLQTEESEAWEDKFTSVLLSLQSIIDCNGHDARTDSDGSG